MRARPYLEPIIGVSPALKRATSLMDRFAPTEMAILLVGPTGTGKDLFARHIHERSRSSGELVDVNCGALPRDMTESLLFGHRRGAFTGAVESVTGHVERANGGTLFLDEVLHLPLSSQVTLLRVLETREVQPLGEGRKRIVDFRIVSAAQDDVGDRVEAGSFRRDLFERLVGIIIDLPRLAERREDIIPLAEYFADGQDQTLEPDTRRVLEEHSWPGNVRELRLAIERAGCLVENGSLPASAVREAIALGRPRDRLRDRREIDRRRRGTDRRHQANSRRSADELVAACQRNGYDALRVAQHFGIALSTLYDRLKAAGISLRSLRRSASLEFRQNSTGIPES